MSALCGSYGVRRRDRIGSLRPAWSAPRMIIIAKIDPFADARMAGPKDLVEQAGAGVAQVLRLHLDERHGGGMVGLGQIQGELVGLVLLVPTVGQGHRAQDQGRHFDQHEHQGHRGDVGEPVEAESARRTARSASGPHGPRRTARRGSPASRAGSTAPRGPAHSDPSRDPSPRAPRARRAWRARYPTGRSAWCRGRPSHRR